VSQFRKDCVHVSAIVQDSPKLTSWLHLRGLLPREGKGKGRAGKGREEKEGKEREHVVAFTFNV